MNDSASRDDTVGLNLPYAKDAPKMASDLTPDDADQRMERGHLQKYTEERRPGSHAGVVRHSGGAVAAPLEPVPVHRTFVSQNYPPKHLPVTTTTAGQGSAFFLIVHAFCLPHASIT